MASNELYHGFGLQGYRPALRALSRLLSMTRF